MGHGIHIQVTIPSAEAEALSQLAAQSLMEEWAEPLFDGLKSPPIPGADEAYTFLDDLRQKNLFTKWGNEGDLILWGMVGNYTDPAAFAEILRPFWSAVFCAKPEIITHSWQKILIVHTESPASGGSGLIEIGWNDDEAADRSISLRAPGSDPFTCI